MKKVKGLNLAVMLLFGATAVGARAAEPLGDTMEENADVKAVETTVSADLVSGYVWRGLDLGSVAVQPTLGIGWKGLSLSAWGSYALVDANDTKELDLTLGYSIGKLNLGVTDYWFNVGAEPEGRYFKYKAHRTNHLFEANVGYDFGFASLQWFTNFAGNDGLNKDGKRAYSSYVEANIPFRVAGVDWTGTVGVVPYVTDLYDASGFAVTNLSLRATKEIKVTNSFSLPVFGQVTANPRSEKAYLVFGFTLQP